ncbi:FAD-dependent oxidoreductase [Pseudonocardia nantongensis]|uniref:oxidoreductase n=1 Tax=Pseudonocardia nantongensis TaxID=1181885 RepID=UPI003978470D
MASVHDPVRVGGLLRPHRLFVPPHGGGRGSLLGSPEQFEKHCAYWLARVRGGIGWVGGGPGYVRHPLVPGFESAGVGAHTAGLFRHSRYAERQGELSRRIHAAGGVATVQLVLQGGLPLVPSATLSGHVAHAAGHVLSGEEIAWLVAEYAESAALAVDAGADVVELHAGHDDLLQWFLSPRTNRRTDEWGGSADRRLRLLREVCAAIRARVPGPLVLGLRLTLDERIEGGYGAADCCAMIESLTADGAADYFSVDVGSNWGAPSYVPTAVHDDAEWAADAAAATAATPLPVGYVGRVPDVATADRIVAAGQADLVGVVRAAIADPDLLADARAGAPERTRPCIVLNDCIDRVTGAGLPFACGVNPDAGHEHLAPPDPATRPSSVLVVGGGPAGTEFAAQAARRGHRVRLLERADELGGRLALAARARANRRYRLWLDWQRRRLDELGVRVQTGTAADAGTVLDAGADVVALATGAGPRLPDGAAGAVPEGPPLVRAEDVLAGSAVPGRRVVVVAEDDSGVPLVLADHLAGAGHEVRLVHGSPAPSPDLGRYSNGSLLARLDECGARTEPMTRLTGTVPGGVRVAHTYSGRERVLEGVDTVVLACGTVADDALHRELSGRAGGLHLLGDAYAPRGIAAATRQAWALARTLDERSEGWLPSAA